MIPAAFALSICNFNPRSRTGSDVTMARLHKFKRKFQSTLPHGERRSYPDSLDGQRRFQSTLPHGERLGGFFFYSIPSDFNPRSRTGSDSVWLNHL